MVRMISCVVRWALISLACAEWDRDNLDPALADPQSAITCAGLPPSFDVADYLIMSDRPATLQLMCAQTQYGGYPSGHNAGGFCQQQTEYVDQTQPVLVDGVYVPEIRRGQWEFRIDKASLRTRIRIPREMDLRFSRYCQMRCICTGVPVAERAPVAYNGPLPNSAPARAQKAIFTIDLGDASSARMSRASDEDTVQQLYSRIGSEVVNVVKPERDTSNLYSIKQKPVTLYYKNRIVCNGAPREMLGLRVPAPAQIANYNNIIELCGVFLSGGHPSLNLGGYCHYNPTTNDGFLSFADEMTPIADWTVPLGPWTPSPVLQQVMIARAFCYRRCTCVGKELTRSEEMDKMWELLLHISGRPGIAGPQSNTRTTAGGGLGGGSTIKSKMSSGLNKLVGKFGKQNAGFLPSDFGLFGAGEIDYDELDLPESRDGQCRVPTCSVPSDCIIESTDACPYRPLCVVDPKSRKSMVDGGLSNIIYFASSICIAKHTRYRLNGRGVDNVTDTSDWPCACNATYVSHGCCSSPEGMVWEAPHLMLGELKA